MVIAATNRKQDLDPALLRCIFTSFRIVFYIQIRKLFQTMFLEFLLTYSQLFFSRFDSMITFGLPDQQTRQEIVAQYAKHLSKTELAELAVATEE